MTTKLEELKADWDVALAKYDAANAAARTAWATDDWSAYRAARKVAEAVADEAWDTYANARDAYRAELKEGGEDA